MSVMALAPRTHPHTCAHARQRCLTRTRRTNPRPAAQELYHAPAYIGTFAAFARVPLAPAAWLVWPCVREHCLFGWAVERIARAGARKELFLPTQAKGHRESPSLLQTLSALTARALFFVDEAHPQMAAVTDS